MTTKSVFERFGEVIDSTSSMMALAGTGIYAMSRAAHEGIYSELNLRPEDVGISQADILVQAALGTAIVASFVFCIAAIMTGVIRKFRTSPQETSEISLMERAGMVITPAFIASLIWAFVLTTSTVDESALTRRLAVVSWCMVAVIAVVASVLIVMILLDEHLGVIGFRGKPGRWLVLALGILTFSVGSLVMFYQGQAIGKGVCQGQYIESHPIYSFVSISTLPVYLDHVSQLPTIRSEPLGGDKGTSNPEWPQREFAFRYLGNASLTHVLWDVCKETVVRVPVSTVRLESV